MIQGGTLISRSFTKWRGSHDEHEEHKGKRGKHERKHEGKHERKHTRTSPITHPLDNQTHKITRYMNNKGKDTWVEFISKRRS